jgi:hypothetical protein
MYRKTLMTSVVLALGISLAAGAYIPPAPGNLSPAEIVDRNVAARGGLSAWRAVQAMSFAGKLDAGGKQNVQLPFVMEMKRPRKARVEIEFANDKAVQVYDGANGWKLRPFLGRRDVEPFSAEELKSASMESELDGPLVDYAAKGTQIELAGKEKVEDRDAYKLKLTTKDGQALHIWIDAQTFLETKVEGQPRRLDGVYHPVEVYYRDYRPVNGLQIPHVLETRVLPVAQSAAGARQGSLVQAEKIVIDKVMVNPKLQESRFTKPQIAAAPKAK